MPIIPPALLAILAGILGFVAGLLLLYGLSRRWLDDARRSGHAGRDAEIATLVEQRDAAVGRSAESAARIERYERDWSSAEQNLCRLSTQAGAHQAQAEQLGHQLADARRGRDEAQTRLVELTRQHAALEAGTREQAQSAAEKLHVLERAEQRLREAFQNLANQILDDKAERFREQSSQQLGGLLDPLKLQLKEFRETINATHATEQRERGMLAQEINTLKELNQRISEDAINLTRALKGDTRTQGAWGELVLERVLEASGLQAGREYETQTSYEGAEGGRQRPDVIVHLPEDKDIVIDAKVSLVGYERFVAAIDEAGRTAALGEHVASLRRHIEGLSARNYSDIEGLRTLDFVLLFVPVEAAFIEAVRSDDRLYTQALAKNICLVSPSTLLATLRTVAHLWRIERRNVNAMEIAKCGAQLHDNFVLMVDELEALGSQLDKAKSAHASVLRRLTEGGRGSVLLQVQRLADMDAPVKKSLPAGLLARAGAGESTAESEPNDG